MIEPNSRPPSDVSPTADPQWPEGEALRHALAQGDRALGRIGPILGHLLTTRDQSLFSDELVARIRGMLTHLAWQILRIQAEATGVKGREEFAADHGEALSEKLFATPSLVAHCHALALEWQLTSRLETDYGLDPVISPLLQTLIGHEDAPVASAAMASLAAQARFAQAQRRMELPLGELPGDLFHALLLAWRGYNGEDASDALIRAEGRLRADFDEAAGRLSLLERVVTLLGKDSAAALTFDQAGIALFLSAVMLKSGQPRDIAAVSTHHSQMARLGIGLRAAGLRSQDIEAQLVRLHPDRDPPNGLADIGTREALNLLTRSTNWPGE
jgi:hypothetical protein